MTNLNSLELFLGNIKRGTFGITMITVTTPSLLSGYKGGDVKKVTLLTNVALGYGYESNVNLKLEKNGITEEFKSSKPKGKHWFNFPYLLQSDKNNNQYYLRCTIRSSMKKNSIYLCNGHIANEKEIAEIKLFTRKSYPSKKQMNLGLTEEETVKPFDYKLESLVYIKQGEKEYKSNDFSLTEIKALFQ